MLPRLYTLDVRAVIGHIGETVPPEIYCPACGRTMDHYREVQLAIDEWPECDLVAGAGAVFFASERLLAELERIGATGYADWPASLSLSDDFRRSHRGFDEVKTRIPSYRHFVITGRCDGPWIQNTRGEACTRCGQPAARSLDFAALLPQLIGEAPSPPRVVYADTWHGEDFFELTEPGPALITERIANMLCEMGNLRKDKIVEKDKVRRLMPRYAQALEKADWEVPKCVSLGAADWVTRSC